jgi:hypothetical protein
MAISFGWAGFLAARSTGRTGECATADGCDCHDSIPNANGNVHVTITGPQLVTAGSTYDYTISVSGTPSGSTGGFNLCASGGTLIAGTGSKVGSGELTHSNGDNRFWAFQWTAPTTGSANQSFVAVAQATHPARPAVRSRIFPLTEVEVGSRWRFTVEHPGALSGITPFCAMS